MVPYPPAASALGLVLLAIGYLSRRYAYEITRFEETLDAIGRKPAGPVEPADWNVGLTRAMGTVTMAFGALLLVTAVIGFLT